MTKLYGVSCHHSCRQLVCHRLCRLCCQLLRQLYTKIFPCTINYILYGETIRTVQQLLTLFATLLLLLLLIVIYDGVGGTYDKTIIMGWYVLQWWWWIVDLLVEFVFMSVSIYYFNYICTVGWCCWLLYMMVSCWYRSPGTQHGSQCDEHLWWCHAAISSPYQVQWITYFPMGTIQMTIIPVYLPLLCQWEPYKRPCCHPRCFPSPHCDLFITIVL